MGINWAAIEIGNTPGPMTMHGVFVHEKFLDSFEPINLDMLGIFAQKDAEATNTGISFMTYGQFEGALGFTAFELGDDELEERAIRKLVRHASVVFSDRVAAVMFRHREREPEAGRKKGRARAMGRFFKNLCINQKYITDPTFIKKHPNMRFVYGPPYEKRDSDKKLISTVPQPFEAFGNAVNVRLDSVRRALKEKPGYDSDWTIKLAHAAVAWQEESTTRNKLKKEQHAQRKKEKLQEALAAESLDQEEPVPVLKPARRREEISEVPKPVNVGGQELIGIGGKDELGTTEN